MSGLFVWVEGDDDERFWKTILEVLFVDKYDWIKPIQYAQKTKKSINDYIKSIESMGAEYIFFSDNDSSPCVVAKKEKVQSVYGRCATERIQIVVEEIESWYLAGLPEQKLEEWTLPNDRNTDALTKEQFDVLIPEKFSRTDFMVEVLKYFSIQTARRKNQSFERFCTKFA